ncbi:hypothetical protein [Flammeovirga sp. SJP92]|uniref:hypothetical protein n=1 Tax=Flammeovirga sp. SJP92 TaxID=1775430 RepID=UPI0007877AA7|nr:hypothetical protein [Flammeovirga sp. SJP92]KXX71926.1 hypothetical protein AVL50_03835 [Flammeovirga sp. SJP92]
MFKQSKLLIIGLLISILGSSCEQEEVQTTIENLPTLTLDSTGFLRGTSTLQLSIEKEDDIEVTEVIFTANGQSLNVDTKQENGQWLFTFDSKQLEEGYQEITFEALLASEKKLPQSSVKESFEIEVDNYLPTYLVRAGFVTDKNYQGHLRDRYESQETIMFFDKNQEPISEPIYLNDFAGELKILIPEDNRDQVFYKGILYSYINEYKIELYTTNKLDYCTLNYTEVLSQSTELNTEYNRKRIQDRKTVTVAYPNNSITVSSFRSQEMGYTFETINGINYYTLVLNEYDDQHNQQYTSIDYFYLKHYETNKSISILTEIMNDGDTLMITEEDILNSPAQTIITTSTPPDERLYYYLYFTINGKNYFDYIYEEYDDEGNSFVRIPSAYYNVPDIDIKYCVFNRKYEQNGYSEINTLIEDPSNKNFNIPYPINYLNHTLNGSEISIATTNEIDENYFKRSGVTYTISNPEEKVNYIYRQSVLSYLEEELKFDFSKIHKSFLEAHNGKFQKVVNSTVNYRDYTLGNTKGGITQPYFLMKNTIYENSNTRMNGPYTITEMDRQYHERQIEHDLREKGVTIHYK